MQTLETRALDGNAAAGTLAQLFATEPTTMQATCAACGATGPLGAARLYSGAGGVLRCAGCEAVLLRVVSAPGRLFVTLGGIRCLEVPVA